MKNERIMWIAIVVLAILCVHLASVARVHKTMDSLYEENLRLYALKQRTENFVSANANVETKQIFQQLGYTILYKEGEVPEELPTNPDK